MFFQYLGNKPMKVSVPGEQYVFDVMPSKNGQRTTNARFYQYIVSPDFGESHLFRHVDDYVIPEIQPQSEAAKGDSEESMAEGQKEVKSKKRVKETD